MMTKQKHTPGPWAANEYGSHIEVATTAANVPLISPPIVSWLGFDDAFRKKAEHRANAKLIAAAPSLLAVGAEALEWLENHACDESDPGVMGLIKNLRAVIDTTI
jgi:hypothetical protein